jgi:CHRD domain
MKPKAKIPYFLAVATGILATGCATVEETVAEAIAETRRATLTGSQIVGSAGDPDGTAQAELTISDETDQICYDINDVRNLGSVTGITINRGSMGSNGPVVLRLNQPNEGGWKNCVKRAEWLEDRMENNPSRYYVVINTAEYPSGAIRGQFSPN